MQVIFFENENRFIQNMIDKNVEDNILKALESNEQKIDLSKNFEYNESVAKLFQNKLKQFPNIEEIIWPVGYSETESIYDSRTSLLKDSIKKQLEDNRKE